MNVQMSLSNAKDLFLAPCNSASSSKSNIDILNYVHVSIFDHKIKVVGTDSQALIIKNGHIECNDDFAVCIEANKLAAVLSGFDDTSKDIKFDFNFENKVQIKYGRSKMTIATADASAFPIPRLEQPTQYAFICDSKELVNAFSEIQYARAKRDVRQFLNHISYSIANGVISMFASDGHRLVKTNVTVLDCSVETQGILPVGLLELIHSVNPSGKCKFYFDNSNFFCEIDGLILASKFVAEKFTDVSKLLTPPILNTMTMKTTDLMKAVNRVRQFLGSVKLAKLTLTLNNNDLMLNADAGTGNEIDDFIEVATTHGNDGQLSLNPTYLLDAIKNIKSDLVSLSFTSSNMLKISDPSNAEFDAVIMAMR